MLDLFRWAEAKAFFREPCTHIYTTTKRTCARDFGFCGSLEVCNHGSCDPVCWGPLPLVGSFELVSRGLRAENVCRSRQAVLLLVCLCFKSVRVCVCVCLCILLRNSCRNGCGAEFWSLKILPWNQPHRMRNHRCSTVHSVRVRYDQRTRPRTSTGPSASIRTDSSRLSIRPPPHRTRPPQCRPPQPMRVALASHRTSTNPISSCSNSGRPHSSTRPPSLREM